MFALQQDAEDFVHRLAMNMHKYDMKDYLTGDILNLQYDKEVLNSSVFLTYRYIVCACVWLLYNLG